MARVAWQRQIRDSHLSEGVPNVPHLDVNRAMVTLVSRRQAAAMILKYEWLGTMGNTSLHYGIFFGDFLAGVVCVALQPPSPSTHLTFQVEGSDICYLSRGACTHWAPPNTNSRLIAGACRLMRRHAPSRKLIVAFADEDAGEIGTIYQACNWTYIGLARAQKQFISPDGQAYDPKIIYDRVRQKGRTPEYWHSQLESEGWTRKYASAKHRYCYVLDRKDKMLAKRVEGIRKPYPKRYDDNQLTCVQSIDQPMRRTTSTGEGGANPTCTLSLF